MLKNNIQKPELSELNKLDRQAVFDLATILLVLVTVKQLLLPYSFQHAGPASTLTAMIVGTWLLSRRGLTWSDLGLRKPKNLINTLLLTAVTFLTIAFIGSGMSWLTSFFFESVGDSDRFSQVEGNLLFYIWTLVLVWTHSSFFEELLFRAFIITKASAVLGGGLKADLVAVLLASVFFGYRHYYYQGMKGAIVTGSIGLGLSLLYLWFGRRNILPLIIGHGLVNTIYQTQRFLGISGD